MIAAGHSPSVRLFEAAACETPVLSDRWDGLGSCFRPGRDILLPDGSNEVVQILRDMPETRLRAIGTGGAARVRGRHDARTRSTELEGHLEEARERLATGRAARAS